MATMTGQRIFGRARMSRVVAAVAALGMVAGSTLAVSTAGAASVPGTKISIVQASGFGKVLADGNTVYTLKPSSTPCTAACMKIWPPVVLPTGVKHATAGAGVDAAKLGTAKVQGGGLQVTYGGKRLYLFFQDTAPGQVHGNITDKWGKWSPVVTAKSGSSGSNSGSGGSSAGSGGASF
jgi:predicted lipoprotein with Yx(FWY)xxD motif